MMHKYIILLPVLILSSLFNPLKAQNDTTIFMKNLNSIIHHGEDGKYASLKGELLSPATWEPKVYDCQIKLTGFETTFTEKGGELLFQAVSKNFHVANARLLLDKKMREKYGLPGYDNSPYTGTSPAIQQETFDTMTLLKQEFGKTDLIICKRKGGAGYRIFIVKK